MQGCTFLNNIVWELTIKHLITAWKENPAWFSYQTHTYHMVYTSISSLYTSTIYNKIESNTSSTHSKLGNGIFCFCIVSESIAPLERCTVWDLQ